MNHVYNAKDVGIYGEAAYGRAHVRNVLADLVSEWLEDDDELLLSLRAPECKWPDDLSDEEDALDELNLRTDTDTVAWQFINGDVCLALLEL